MVLYFSPLAARQISGSKPDSFLAQHLPSHETLDLWNYVRLLELPLTFPGPIDQDGGSALDHSGPAVAVFDMSVGLLFRNPSCRLAACWCERIGYFDPNDRVQGSLTEDSHKVEVDLAAARLHSLHLRTCLLPNRRTFGTVDRLEEFQPGTMTAAELHLIVLCRSSEARPRGGSAGNFGKIVQIQRCNL